MIRSFNDITPQTASAAFVAGNATVLGDVSLGQDSSVWYGAVLRGDEGSIRIGVASNVQDNCTLHTDATYPLVIGENVSVGHGAVLHGCTLEDDVLIGMHATVLNGAVIGRGSVVAAGAVVLEGRILPPCSLAVGVPAVVKGQVSPTAVAGNQENAQLYVHLAREHAAL